MSVQTRLILIAPYWTVHVEQFIAITKDYFDVSVLTFKSDHLAFQSDKIEILQCFETLSPWEIIKITPWILQHQPAVFHFFLNAPFKTTELIGFSSLVSLLKSLPDGRWTYSLNTPLNTWGRFLLKPMIEDSSPLTIWNFSSQLSSTPKSEIQLASNYSQKKMVPFSNQKFWLFPYSLSQWTPFQKQVFKTLLQLHPEVPIAIPDWGNLPLRKRHLWRSEFLIYSGQIHIPFHFSWESLSNSIESIIFAGGAFLPWNEMDLIKFAQYGITLFLDNEQALHLEAPWTQGNQFWILNKKSPREDLLKFFQNTTYPKQLQNLSSLLQFQDYKSNQLIRAIAEKGAH